MKDKAIVTKSGDNFYVVEDLTFDNRMFVMGIEFDPVKETVKREEFVIMECKVLGDEIELCDLDTDTGIVIANKFVEKIRNSAPANN